MPIPNHPTLYAVIAAPYVVPAGVLALLIFLLGRRWALAVLAACLTAALVVPQLPWHVGADPASDGIRLRAMTINMWYGRADPAPIVRLAAEQADVVMIQELNDEAVQGLSAAGFDDVFPYRQLDARPGADGVGLYSRYPITAADKIGGYPLAMVSARIDVDGVEHPPTLLSVHLSAPWPQPIDGWRRDLANFPGTLADVAEKSDGGAVLVGGDFNSTIDMRPFRGLLSNGYREAAEQSGAGRQLTYPANRRLPSFMGIDHVLTRNCTAVSTHTVELPGTDHRALLTTVVLPRR